MTALEKIRIAQAAAKSIIASFTAQVPADAVETRKTALMEEIASMKNGEKIEFLIGKIVALEAPKADHKVTVEQVAQALMESTDCATLTWSDIADLIVTSGLGEKTSQASIASYASKKKDVWNIAPREKLRFNAADLLAAVGQ